MKNRTKSTHIKQHKTGKQSSFPFLSFRPFVSNSLSSLVSLSSLSSLLSLLSLVSLSLSCCSPNQDTRLEQALRLSGENRGELEKVLDYFSQSPEDSLKLKSAIFLIENMPGHWGPDSSCIQDYKTRIDTLTFLSSEERQILMNLPSKHPEWLQELVKVEDIRTVKANDLIRHIEWACRLKDSCTWLADVGFDIFAEHILPYRFENEFVNFPKDTSDFQLPETIRYALHNYNNCQYSLNALSSYILREELMTFNYKIKDASLRKFIFTNENKCNLLQMRMRRSGIPVAIDYSPIQRIGDNSTYWHIIMDPRLIPKYTYRAEKVYQGKIYRRTFSPNPIPNGDHGEFIPPFFRNPFQKDVTDLYFYTVNLNLSLLHPSEIKYAYLTTYDDRTWQPIAYGEVRNKQCLFTKLGKNSVYLPVYYPQGEMRPLGSPFILRSNQQIDSLNGCADSVVHLRIERLCPYTSRDQYSEYLIKSQFECADNALFKNADTVYTIKQPSIYHLHTVYPERKLKKRYWRLKTISDYCMLSELHFLNQDGKILKGRYLIKDTRNVAVLTDNDPLTLKIIKGSVEIDFGQPVCVSSIRYMEANDGHNIWPDHEYELFYYRDNGWVSAGIQKATDQFVLFTDIPANRLYQVKDKTKNKNGRIFTWEKGRIRFW